MSSRFRALVEKANQCRYSFSHDNARLRDGSPQSASRRVRTGMIVLSTVGMIVFSSCSSSNTGRSAPAQTHKIVRRVRRREKPMM